MSENALRMPMAVRFSGRVLARRFSKLLAIPLLYKVLLANSTVILIGATLGTSLATQLQGNTRPVILVGFVVSGLLISVGINFVLLKLALYPLHRLRETMRQVQTGDLAHQALVNGQDPDADQLAARRVGDQRGLARPHHRDARPRPSDAARGAQSEH